MKRFGWIALASSLLLAPAPAFPQYPNFEGHQIHPLDITPDGSKLLAVNTPDARLSIFSIGVAGDLTLLKEVPVGVEPVSVRARTNTEAWVVNHVSDSISIVDLTAGQERVKQTLSVKNSPPASSCTAAGTPFDCCTGSGTAKFCGGDEPADVVFAGTGDARAFVSLSQRNRVDVFNASSPSTPLFFLPIDGEDPRALARNATGSEVYAAVFESGNQTLIISGELGQTVPRSRVTSASSPYGGAIVPPPPGWDPNTFPFSNAPCTGAGVPAACCTGSGTGTCARPFTSIIVKWRSCAGGTHWCDQNDNSWDNLLKTPGNAVIQMRDRDVAVIGASAGTPSVSGYVSGVGTLNFGIAVNPATSNLYVSNTDARNQTKFESTPTSAPALNGHLVDTRITVASTSAVQRFINLNPLIDYNQPPSAADPSTSLGQPNGMAFNSAGSRLYVAALLSRKVAVLDTSTNPETILQRIDVGEGPTGVALKESANRLYVLNRHENTISVVNTSTNTEVLPRAALFDPEPAAIKNGRKFLYDAQLTSGRGDIACATCHAFGEFDLLAWDLGDPTKQPPYDARPSQTTDSAGPLECGTNPNNTTLGCGPFHPLKGPQTTQTLRGLQGTEPLHWRGDRADFQAFNVAFPGLLMRSAQLSSGDMQAFTDFIMTNSFPPNPNRNLDDTLTSGAASGSNEFTSVLRDGNAFTCNQCHALPTGTNGKFIGAAPDQIQQAVKVPQLRNMYEKSGFALNPDPQVAVPAFTRNGFGFVHDGIVDSLFTFLSNPIFTFAGNATAINNMIDFMMEFPTGQAAPVGHAVTFNGANNGDATLNAQFSTLLSTLNQGKIDLIVRGVFGGIPRNFRCTTVSPTQASCQPDRSGESAIDAATLKGLAASGSELTFMAVPVGFGLRMGLDRDGDGYFDQDELDAGSNPADANSTPAGAPAVPTLSEWGAGILAALLVLASRRRLRRRAG